MIANPADLLNARVLESIEISIILQSEMEKAEALRREVAAARAVAEARANHWHQPSSSNNADWYKLVNAYREMRKAVDELKATETPSVPLLASKKFIDEAMKWTEEVGREAARLIREGFSPSDAEWRARGIVNSRRRSDAERFKTPTPV